MGRERDLVRKKERDLVRVKASLDLPIAAISFQIARNSSGLSLGDLDPLTRKRLYGLHRTL
jgi:hypothetical protein